MPTDNFIRARRLAPLIVNKEKTFKIVHIVLPTNISVKDKENKILPVQSLTEKFLEQKD